MTPRMNWADDAPRSTDIEQAVKVFGDRTSLGIIRHLAGVESANYGALFKALSVSAEATSTHFRALDGAAVVSGDLPTGERRGRSVDLSLDADRVRVLNAALVRYALGAPDTYNFSAA